MAASLNGKRVFAAIVSPLSSDFRCDEGRLFRRAKRLLAEGCDGVAIFGTTGEGPGFSAPERKRVLEALLARGFPPERLIVATSAAAAEDAVSLSAHAAGVGVAAILLMPPFFLAPAATEDGVVAFYEQAIAAIGGRAPLILYHIPAVSGISLTDQIIGRLAGRHPGAVAAIKDSGGDLARTFDLCRKFPELAVMVGRETDIPAATAAGAAGTICGIANVAPRLVARLFDAEPPMAAMATLLEFVTAGHFVPTLRAMLAIAEDDPAWAKPLAPRIAVSDADFHERLRRLRERLHADGGVALA